MVKVQKKNLIVPALDKAEKAKAEELEKESSDAENDSESENDEVVKVMEGQKKHKGNKMELANRMSTKKERALRGVLYVGHIPPGFCEPQMKKYFAQFGTITRLRLSRSKRTGGSKGYGFVEFELSEVAKIVADTLNGYLLFGRTLAVKVMPKDLVHPATFKNHHRKIVPAQKANRRKEAARHNVDRSVVKDGKKTEFVTDRQQKRKSTKSTRRADLLASMGIEFGTGKAPASPKKAAQKAPESPKKAPASPKKAAAAAPAEVKKAPAMKKKAMKKKA